MSFQRIVLLGHSRAGLSLAATWQQAGHEIVATWNRDAQRPASGLDGPPPRLETPDLTALDCDSVCVAVRDDVIGDVAQLIRLPVSRPEGSDPVVVFHLSGSQSATTLTAPGLESARLGSLHPLRAFPEITWPAPALEGHLCAIGGADEAWSLLATLAADAGGEPVALAESDRGLWHLGAVFSSNFLVVLMDQAIGILEAAGVDRDHARVSLLRLAQGSLATLDQQDPGQAITGPFARGDSMAVESHLSALTRLDPQTAAIYRTLGVAAMDLSDRTSQPGDGTREAMRALLSKSVEDLGGHEPISNV